MDIRLLADVIQAVRIPVFPIGGIHLENFSSLQNLGVERVAVCRVILLSHEPGKTAEILKNFLLNK